MDVNVTRLFQNVSGGFSVEYDVLSVQPPTNASETFNRSINYTLEEWRDEDYEIGWAGGSPYPSGYSHLGIVLTSFLVTAIMVLIVVGNMLVCVAIATEKSLKTVQNWFIASLAVSDFLVGLVVMPFSLAKELMGYWIFGQLWCEVHSALDVFLCTASINSLCLIALDRYWSVTRAVEYLRKRTPRRSILMICGVWVLSAIISLPPLVGWKKPEREATAGYPECLLSDDVGYVLYSACGSFYVPALVVVFVYCRIFVAARSRARRHLRKKEAARAAAAGLKDRATATTTTTTCTSFSGTSPPGGALPPPQVVQGLPKIPESNGTQPTAPLAPPEIVVEGGEDDQEDEDSRDAPKVTFKEDEVPSETNSLCKDSNDVSPSSLGVPQRLHVQEQAPRRTSLLRAPKFLRSPFGSTLSLADVGNSDEEVSDAPADDVKAKKKKRRKKAKVPKVIEEAVRRPVTTLDAERHKRRIARARERRATLILGLIMASFILAWLPFFVLYVLEALCKSCHIGATAFAVAFWLGYCNSALNPIIYTIFNRDFRKAFRKILFK